MYHPVYAGRGGMLGMYHPVYTTRVYTTVYTTLYTPPSRVHLACLPYSQHVSAGYLAAGGESPGLKVEKEPG